MKIRIKNTNVNGMNEPMLSALVEQITRGYTHQSPSSNLPPVDTIYKKSDDHCQSLPTTPMHSDASFSPASNSSFSAPPVLGLGIARKKISLEPSLAHDWQPHPRFPNVAQKNIKLCSPPSELEGAKVEKSTKRTVRKKKIPNEEEPVAKEPRKRNRKAPPPKPSSIPDNVQVETFDLKGKRKLIEKGADQKDQPKGEEDANSKPVVTVLSEDQTTVQSNQKSSTATPTKRRRHIPEETDTEYRRKRREYNQQRLANMTPTELAEFRAKRNAYMREYTQRRRALKMAKAEVSDK